MAYYAGHDYFIQIQTDPTVDSTPSGSWLDIGYTSPNGVNSSEGGGKGFASGRRIASYDKKGQRTHSIDIELRLGSVNHLITYMAASAMPHKAVRYGIDNQWANLLRRAVCGNLSMNFAEGDQEITASAHFEAIARQDGVTPPDINYSAQQFGSTLFWQHVQTATIGGNDIRDLLMGLSFSIDNQLERKGIRPDAGDDVIWSRCAYEIMVHHRVVTGSLNLHSPLASGTYFTGGDDGTNWGNIVLGCSDVAGGGSKAFTVTLQNVRPTARTQQAVESGAQMQFGVEFEADDVVIALV